MVEGARRSCIHHYTRTNEREAAKPESREERRIGKERQMDEGRTNVMLCFLFALLINACPAIATSPPTSQTEPPAAREPCFRQPSLAPRPLFLTLVLADVVGHNHKTHCIDKDLEKKKREERGFLLVTRRFVSSLFVVDRFYWFSLYLAFEDPCASDL